MSLWNLVAGTRARQLTEKLEREAREREAREAKEAEERRISDRRKKIAASHLQLSIVVYNPDDRSWENWAETDLMGHFAPILPVRQLSKDTWGQCLAGNLKEAQLPGNEIVLLIGYDPSKDDVYDCRVLKLIGDQVMVLGAVSCTSNFPLDDAPELLEELVARAIDNASKFSTMNP